ncbi:MAG: helix-turn-helix transcriptional regulator [Kordiimonadaceae bacterium]|nr:helix-turn-helix transcriptional regulator [Kordiimonadaceae bacterium]
MSLREIFGSNCRQFRKSNNLTQGELAEKTDISIDMIGRIERGSAAPSFNNIEKLAKTLEVPVMAFFGQGMVTFPSGERGKLLQKVNATLSRMNEDELVIAANMLKALKP